MSFRKQVVTNRLHLLEAARLMGLPVVVTEQTPRAGVFAVEAVRGEPAAAESNLRQIRSEMQRL